VTQTTRALTGRRETLPAGRDSHVTVITPPRGWPGLGLGELWRYREICLVLVKRNLMVRYRQTVIGAGWSILQPLALMAVFSVFFGLLARLPTNGLPWPVFYFLGLLPWQMTSKIMTEGTHSVVANSALVTRVYFPRAYFPTSVALSSFIDLVLATSALVVLLAISGIVPGATVVVAPYFIAVAWVAGLGVAFWLSALNVAYRDVSQMLPFLTQMWMFGSPIIYPSALIPEPFHTWYFLNPMALVVEGMRWAIGGTPAPTPGAWLLGTASAVFLLVSGYVFFRRREATFADKV
jgi:lipopolysaccharide transport system permease protein